jgi:phosphomannomutase/phosphoglucomutase
MARVEAHFSGFDPAVDRTDGISLEFADWRLNLRSSNTEPLLRLNVETKRDAALLVRIVSEVECLIGNANND